jgi:hypothetical protein
VYRIGGRIALTALGLAVLAASWSAAQPLAREYGYAADRAPDRVGGRWFAEMHIDRRRAAWLPIPPERLRVENLRGEEVARFYGATTVAANGVFDRRCISSQRQCEITWGGHSITLVPDTDGVLVPRERLAPAPEPAEIDPSGLFEGLGPYR